MTRSRIKVLEEELEAQSGDNMTSGHLILTSHFRLEAPLFIPTSYDLKLMRVTWSQHIKILTLVQFEVLIQINWDFQNFKLNKGEDFDVLPP